MKWRLPTSKADRWAAMLTEVRDTQHLHPGLGAELWTGDASTAYAMRAQLARGLVPCSHNNAAEIPLAVPVAGYVFTTRQVGQTRRAIMAVYAGADLAETWPPASSW